MNQLKYAFLTAIIFLSSTAFSIAQTFSNNIHFGNSDNDYGLSIITDSKGNTITAGGFKGSINFGSFTETAKGNPAIGLFVLKHDDQNKLLWSFSCGNDEEELFYLDADTFGNIYVCGSFYGKQFFGADSFITYPNESNDNFVLKLSPEGQLLWVRHLRGPDHEHVQGMDVSPTGDIYITGFFDKTFQMENTTLENKGSSDVYVFKLTTNNDLVWAKAFGGSSSDWPWDIHLYNQKLYIVSRFSNSVQYQTITANGIGGVDILISEFDTAGNFIQFNVIGGLGNDEPRGIIADASGSLYISGFFSGEINYNNNSFSSKNGADNFLLKLSNNYQYNWAQVFGGAGVDNRVVAPVIDPLNNIIVGGSITGKTFLDSDTLIGKGSRDAVIVSYNKNGKLNWATNIGGVGSDLLGDIHVNTSGRLCVTGRFASTNLILNADTFKNKGASTSDIFITEIKNYLQLTQNINPLKFQPSDFKIVPNPVTSEVHLIGTFSNNNKIILRNIQGNELINLINYTSNQTIDLSHIASGIYFMEIHQSEKKITLQLIKQ